jgi:CRISPR type I-E-associated protein CasB/Cse2
MMAEPETTAAEVGARPPSPGKIVRDWWQALHPRENGSGGDRATLAQLRRAETVNDALTIPATIALWGRVKRRLGHAPNERQTAALAILAGVLAGIDPGGQTGTTFAEALGRTSEGKRRESDAEARLSPLRFAALMRATDAEDRLRSLRRAAAMLKKNAPFNVVQFADDVLGWSDETRRRWIFQYHQYGDFASASAPADNETEEDPTT